jgi:hypothetical protein
MAVFKTLLLRFLWIDEFKRAFTIGGVSARRLGMHPKKRLGGFQEQCGLEHRCMYGDDETLV